MNEICEGKLSINLNLELGQYDCVVEKRPGTPPEALNYFSSDSKAIFGRREKKGKMEEQKVGENYGKGKREIREKATTYFRNFSQHSL